MFLRGLLCQLVLQCAALTLLGTPSFAMMNEDGDACVKGNGSAQQRLTSCSKALDYWLLSSQEKYQIFEARADILLDLERYQEALDDLNPLLRKYRDWDSGYNLRCIVFDE